MKSYMLRAGKRILSGILFCLLLLSICLPAYAVEDDTVKHNLLVKAVDGSSTLLLMQKNGVWYVEATSLAELAHGKAGVSKEQKKLLIFRNNGEKDVTLYSASSEEYLRDGEAYYVPLQDASVAVGVRFYVDGEKIGAEQLKVPTELETELASVFFPDTHNLSQTIEKNKSFWQMGETLARIWSVIPFAGSGSLPGALLGTDERERYQSVVGQLLANEGSLFDALSGMANDAEESVDYADALDFTMDLIEEEGPAAQLLESMGVDEALIELLFGSYSPYMDPTDLDAWISGYSDVVSGMDLDYLLSLCSFYSSVTNAEESHIIAMDLALKNSDNENIRRAVNDVLAVRYGSAEQTLANLYSGWVKGMIVHGISNKWEDSIRKTPTGAVFYALTTVNDFVSREEPLDKNVLYYIVFAAIQRDFMKYYFEQGVSKDEVPLKDLQAVGIMYLKTAITGRESTRAEPSYYTEEIGLATDKLIRILSYDEDEYAPGYDNQALIDWLNKKASSGELDKPMYLVDYLGMTVNELAAIWGEDYTVLDGWYLGGWKSVVYEDDRVPVAFHFGDLDVSGTISAEEKIEALGVMGDDLEIVQGLSCKSTYSDLKEESWDGIIDTSLGAIYKIYLDENTIAEFQWESKAVMSSEFPAVFITDCEKFVHPDIPNKTENYRGILENEASGAMQYSIYDLDGDNTPELITAYVSLTQGRVIAYDVYKLEDGMPFLWKSEEPDAFSLPELTWYAVNDYTGLRS